jgi:protein-tyrosine phosphatase
VILDKRLRVVLVRSGNICRSPIGSLADDRAAAVLRAQGYVHRRRARQVDAEDLTADLLVALDRGHQRVLRSMVAEPDRVRLLRSFRSGRAAPCRAQVGSAPGAEVPDPSYGGPRDSPRCSMIRAAMPGLLDRVRASR